MLHRLINLRARQVPPVAHSPLEGGLAFTIRFAYPDDEDALWRLAALDSQSLPAGPFLVAEVGEELWAAVSLSEDLRAVADPFRHTAVLVSILRDRAAALTGTFPRRRLPARKLSLVFS